MIRLISLIIALAIFLVFIILNIENKCDISFGPLKFEQIPIYISALFSFVLGMLFALPFSISLSRKLRKSAKTEVSAEKKKRWGRNKDKNPAPDKVSSPEEVTKDPGSYGID